MSSVDEVPESPDTHSVSQKKIEANRRNARKSTGPSTATGKTNSRRNALKHGIFSSVVLVEGAEDSHAYRKLVTDLHRNCKPIGRMEEIHVDRLAILLWQQRRALQWERRIIRDQFLVQPKVIDPELQKALGLGEVENDLPLPAGAKFDLLIRYQTTIQSQIRFVLDQLERVQGRRVKNPESSAGQPTQTPLESDPQAESDKNPQE
jgi:hypothetical protein